MAANVTRRGLSWFAAPLSALQRLACRPRSVLCPPCRPPLRRNRNSSKIAPWERRLTAAALKAAPPGSPQISLASGHWQSLRTTAGSYRSRLLAEVCPDRDRTLRITQAMTGPSHQEQVATRRQGTAG